MHITKVLNIYIENLLGAEHGPEVLLQEGREKKELKAVIRINVSQKNINKFKEVLLYILNKIGSIWKIRICGF